MSEVLRTDVLVIGAGPGGLSAALTAARAGAAVLVADALPSAGGQIWRGATPYTPGEAGTAIKALVTEPRVEFLAGASVRWTEPGRTVVLGTSQGLRRVQAGAIILATGATERFMPFPGWTLPGVVGAGGLQALTKSGLDVAGKRVVVAGTGPLLLAVAQSLRQKGARLLGVAEQAPWRSLVRMGAHAATQPGKGVQAARMMVGLLGVSVWPDTYPIHATGTERVEAVTLRRNGRDTTLPCDWLAVGFGLVPEVSVARMLGCAVAGGAVQVDESQRTSVTGVYAAGEVTGIGGADQARFEGLVAGLSAVGQSLPPGHAAEAARHAAFSTLLDAAFALRDEVRALPAADTVVCRCEDVTHGELRRKAHWEEAKLHTRCGMGACQGRTCAPITAALYGWSPPAPRPPLLPTPLEDLMS